MHTTDTRSGKNRHGNPKWWVVASSALVLLLQACGGVETDRFCDMSQYTPQIPVCEYQGFACTYASATLNTTSSLGAYALNTVDSVGSLSVLGKELYVTQPSNNLVYQFLLNSSKVILSGTQWFTSTLSSRIQPYAVQNVACRALVYTDAVNQRVVIQDHNKLTVSDLVPVGRFKRPGPMALDPSGFIFLLDLGDPAVATDPGVLYRVDAVGNVSSVLSNVNLRSVTSLASGTVSNQARLYMTRNNLVEYINPSLASPIVTTLAIGSVQAAAVATDSLGNLYMLENQGDANNHNLRGHGVSKYSISSNTVTRIAGVLPNVSYNNMNVIVSYDASSGAVDDASDATLSRFKFPSAMSVDQYGNIYILDRGNGSIRVVSPNAN